MNRFSTFLGISDMPYPTPHHATSSSLKGSSKILVPESYSSMGQLFGSLYEQGESSVQRFQSKQIDMTNVQKSFPNPEITTESIKVDLSSIKNAPKRSSFIPVSFEESIADTRMSRKKIFTYGGATVQNIKSEPTVKTYCTGSKYIGEYNQLGFCGKGIYRFPHGVIYDGHFNRRGDFHGTGILIYPNGQRIEGIWRHGKMVKGGTYFVSKDEGTLDNQYCKMPDRRFQIELKTDIQPAGQEYLTNDLVPRKIPPNMYDTGNGFYDPTTKLITSYGDVEMQESLSEITKPHDNDTLYNVLLTRTVSQDELLRSLKTPNRIINKDVIGSMATDEKEDWIISKCRKGWDEPTGYRPDFYEVWTAGYKRDSFANTVLLNRLMANESVEDLVISRLSKHVAAVKASHMVSRDDSNPLSLYSFIQKPAYEQLSKVIERPSLAGSSMLHTWSTIFMPLGNTAINPEPEKKPVFRHQKSKKRSTRFNYSAISKGTKPVQIIEPRASLRLTKKSIKHLLVKKVREIHKEAFSAN
ncbi:uncharacterized protein LOC126744569 [Anthonomus grandis grandis]|uniref:uncharacterized protein LOC126744569 n=1 Tax=Anthonomus grandis grandis TaxID=2921223 RepID=UPI002165C7D3|nr:uncharacterized protein LOC126744569 [Anthonomus grandis grandis]